MGAYDNPRFFNAPDMTVGARAFIGTFQKGLQAGIAEGEKMIAERKEYEAGIYEQGKALEEELQAAVDNNLKTQDEMKSALRSFYDEALAVEMPTKKGIGGLFATAKEKRLGEIDLQEMQRSFTSAVTPVNTMYDYAYTSGMDIDENEDKGSEFYADKKLIHDAIKSGNIKTNIEYIKGKGFQSNIQVLDANGNIVKEYSPQLAQTIFTASGKEQRDAIDARHDELQVGIQNQVKANVANAIERAKTFGYREYAEGEKEARDIIKRALGTANLGDDELPSEKTLSLINDEYNNHGNISLELKRDIMRKSMSGLVELENDELDAIINEPMQIGSARFKEILKGKGFDDEQIGLIYKRSLKGKAGIVEEAAFQEVREKGLLDKGYNPPAPKTPEISDGTRSAVNLNIYAKDRANELSDAASDIVSNFKRVKSDMPSDAPKNYLKMPNPEYDEELADEEGYNVPAEIEVLKLDDTFAQGFQGKTMKLKDGKIRNIDNVYVDLNGNIKFDFKEGEISGADDEGKFKEDLLEETANFNIYNPKSMETLYMAAGAELSGEKSKVQYRNQYKTQISNAYLNNPEQFEDPQMDGWINYIYKNLGTKGMLKNERFVNWLKKTNSKGMNPTLQALRKSVLP